MVLRKPMKRTSHEITFKKLMKLDVILIYFYIFQIKMEHSWKAVGKSRCYRLLLVQKYSFVGTHFLFLLICFKWPFSLTDLEKSLGSLHEATRHIAGTNDSVVNRASAYWVYVQQPCLAVTLRVTLRFSASSKLIPGDVLAGP